MFPKKTISSVSGISGIFGAIGGVLFSYNAGLVVSNYGYIYLFILASGAYLVALLLTHSLVPTMKPVRL
jgi:ACS family hexuronate transporter-like MFS transporter